MQEELPKDKNHSTKLWLIAGSVIISLIILFALVLVGYKYLFYKHNPLVKIPSNVTSQALFPVYIPNKLPGSFKMDQNRWQYKDGALLGYASDNANNGLALSEESLPNNFSVTDAFGSNLLKATKLSTYPYLAISGTLTNGDKVLSISAGSTWIIFTYKTNLSQQDLKTILNNLAQQQ